MIKYLIYYQNLNQNYMLDFIKTYGTTLTDTNLVYINNKEIMVIQKKLKDIEKLINNKIIEVENNI